jgi:acyl-CoA thioesterase
VNGLGICHGGFLFLLADSALGYASNGDGVPAVRRAGYGRSGLYDVTVWRPADGALIAELRGQTRSPRSP